MDSTLLNVNELNHSDPLRRLQSEPHREARARVEHLRILLHHSVFVFLGNLAASLALSVGLWGSVQHSLLISWVSVLIIFNIARWIVGRNFPAELNNEQEIRRWDQRFIISAAVSGVLWGAAGSLFYVPNQPEYSLFLALMIVGMCAAATASLSFHRIAYPVFLLPAITPISLHLMLDEKMTANAVGFVLPFYFLLLFLLSKKIYATAHDSILGRINNQYLALLDYLTGVANRRAFESALDREWYRAMRDKSVLSLVIGDIDNFKLHNDTFGHAAGDHILKDVAMLLEKHTQRGADLVARIGGEEFAIILPGTDLENAVALAESMRVDIKKLATGENYKEPEVTMSFGVSSVVPRSFLKVGQLFSRADEALYAAKRKGKDRVEAIYGSNDSLGEHGE